MQQVIWAASASSMLETVDGFLKKGWKIVPGTIGAVNEGDYRVTAWAVVEKEDGLVEGLQQVLKG